VSLFTKLWQDPTPDAVHHERIGEEGPCLLLVVLTATKKMPRTGIAPYTTWVNTDQNLDLHLHLLATRKSLAPISSTPPPAAPPESEERGAGEEKRRWTLKTKG
jgi:hypothetical protein